MGTVVTEVYIVQQDCYTNLHLIISLIFITKSLLVFYNQGFPEWS